MSNIIEKPKGCSFQVTLSPEGADKLRRIKGMRMMQGRDSRLKNILPEIIEDNIDKYLDLKAAGL